MAQSPEYPDLPFVVPRSWTAGRAQGPPRFITIHYTAGAEGPGTAMNGALYDQKRTDGTSTHYFVDDTQVVQCVKTTDTAHTALRHGNWWGIHYEQCGTAQTRAQWLDPVSRATIRNTARQAARDMQRWNIPLVRVQGRGVRDLNARGVCGHYDWTVGWPEDGGTHDDPGPEYPWDVLFADMDEFLGGNTMAVDEQAVEDLEWRADAFGAMSEDIRGGRFKGNPDPTLGKHQGVVALHRIEAKLDALTLGGVNVDALVAAMILAMKTDPQFRALLVETSTEGANKAEDS